MASSYNEADTRAKLIDPALHAKKHGMPAYEMIAQENKILMPSAFSPLQ